MKEARTKFIVLGLVTLILFICMLYLDYFVQTTYKNQEGYVAKVSIPAGTTLTEENIGDYVKKADIPQDCVSEYTVKDPSVLLDQLSRINIGANDIITVSQFLSGSSGVLSISNPVETSIMLEQDKMVAGTLRAGDKVDVHYVDATSKQDTVSVKGVYIDRVYDSDGALIDNENTDAKAHTVVLITSEGDASNLAKAKASGDVYLVKSLEDAVQKDVEEVEDEEHVPGVSDKAPKSVKDSLNKD